MALVKLGHDPEAYYQEFLPIVHKKMGLAVTFDNAIVEVVVKLLDQLSWQSYSSEKGNVKRNSLFLVGDVLAAKGYIRRQSHAGLQAYKEKYIKEKL